MPYYQLQRISELDKQISELHSRLAEHYRERALLLSDNPAASPAVTSRKDAKKQRPLSTSALYKELKSAWDAIGFKLPRYNFVNKRLTAVLKLQQDLQEQEPEYKGKLRIIAVPPHKSLDRLLSNSPFANNIEISEALFSTSQNPSLSWDFALIPDPGFLVTIDNLGEDLHKYTSLYPELNYHGLGMREVIAAEVHGLKIITEYGWTLLLKDTDSSGRIPCVTRQNGKIIFDIEDAHYLLGVNFMQPIVNERR